MRRILFITTELPYFPGQGGLMALHMRYLSTTNFVGVVGPRYPHQPEDALQKMRDTVQRSYWWPEHPTPGSFFDPAELGRSAGGWLVRLPRSIRKALLERLTGLHRHPPEALMWRAALNNLAPKILEALDDQRWNALLLAQSSSAVWLPFLPATLARCIYLHDIRSDYLRRRGDAPSRNYLRRLRSEEREAVSKVDAVATVSELDRERAITQLGASENTTVAPICVDLDYYHPDPAETVSSPPQALFTGHLSHPPNVDAVAYLTQTIWPQVVAAVPNASLKIVGLQPSAKVQELVIRSPSTELIANAPDIRKYFRAARVFVVPMRYGGGVRQKIVEAWAMGVPVVTTRLGAEGLAARDNENCWLRDRPEEFAAQVTELLLNSAPRAAVQAARKIAEVNHAPATACPPLAAQLYSAVARARDRAPRVLFDLRWLVSGKVGGVEQMAHELIHELASFDRTFEYRLWGTSQVLSAFRFRSDFRSRSFPVDGWQARYRTWRDSAVELLGRTLDAPSVSSRALRALEWYTHLDFTVVHGIPSYVHPELRRFPSVVTIHDLQHIHRPDLFSAPDIVTREREYRESCDRATHVLCPSEFTREDVHRHYGVPLARITTIYNLPPRLTAKPIGISTRRKLLNRMNINSPFLFYPAQPWLHKNHEILLRALLIADRRLPSEYKLVMSGQPFPLGHPATALMREPVIQRRTIHVGYRTPREMVALYSSATALIFPSLFEGFGMPLIEAMQQGCPVVCGTHTCLPEIVGNAALFTDVTSADSLAGAMHSITQDDALRVGLRQRGFANLQRFERRRLAEMTRAIYRSVHEAHFS